jgi:hypothetical protein
MYTFGDDCAIDDAGEDKKKALLTRKKRFATSARPSVLKLQKEAK